MDSIVDVADSRRHEFLAEAARERLARQGRPARPLAAPSRERLANAARTLHAITAQILSALASHARDRRIQPRGRPLLPSPR